MSTIKSSSEHLTLNADGAAKEIKLQANGVEKAKVTSTGVDVTGRITTDGITEDASGNVGIGTSSPSNKLQVNTTASDSQSTGTIVIEKPNFTSGSQNHTALTLKNASIGQGLNLGLFTDSGGNRGSFIDCPSAELGLSFRTSGSERMRIDSSGNFMVGKTSHNTAGDGLSMNAGTATNVVIKNSNGNTGDELLFLKRSNGSGTIQFQQFYFNNTNVGNINCSSSSTTYATSSDYRLKENVVPMSASIDRLKQLNPVRFNFTIDADTTVDGFLAHEAQAVVPEAVVGTKDAMKTEEYEVTPAVEATYDDDGNELTPAVEAVMGEREVPDYQGIDQAKLVPLLTSALQEAVAKIETLETTVADLTTRIEALEA